MIYTVTLNPAIDYVVRLERVEPGTVNRMESSDTFAGGKGINVSRILKRLGYASTATGFVGGFTGEFIKKSLETEEIGTQFVQVDQDTRINVKLKADQETEINGLGPVVTDEQLRDLETLLSNVLEGDLVVFAGSAPASLGNQVYNRLIPLVKQAGAEVVCDFEGETLIDSLAHQPLLVKPNNHELGAIFGVTLDTREDMVRYAQEILVKGAKNVIVSMAGDGALLVTPEATYFAKPIKGSVKNSVGAGDSMVAGFTGEYTKSHNLLEALKWGVACGTATAFSDDLASMDAIQKMYEKVEVEIL
ncbi:1-phosphofructokinase [Streptococcus azizii]|uniref:Tagatose-6-phosphate kinase n=1 Tax=Streptococcus azizii TaxID=1579424 RepID=A0AB36JQ68_9STRE|nr:MULTISPECIES: 1-phosphofructokinase [Streptococcus]MBF0775537.1 1-phosphofructokinase [Streptococcus sp. 19428wD3_AN2]ONK27225.1 1-phosphofructokinase [Streptococcus azizii]ONK27700.1 1-phosphofructokinase [Streptococcus azizii]ONK29879.1 1-phosphofructokinase [Streptococcus azizii]TFU84427.1 1-phosphofructokinase [Streptococcus sp. AN2]